MFVRVYDKQSNTYFKSEMYAKINTGWFEKRLIRVPCETGDYLKFIDYIDKEKDPTEVLINVITPDMPSDWIVERSNSTIDSYKEVLEPEIRFIEYIGVKWLYEDRETLLKLLEGESILVSGSVFEDKIINNYIEGWNYIEAQDDIDNLMNETAGFHDSIIKSLNYISGGYVASNKSMYPFDSKRTITLLVDSQITDPIEMVFEGVTAMSLHPSGESRTAEILGSSIFMKDGVILFSDEILSDFDTSHMGTWITSYSLRWRFV